MRLAAQVSLVLLCLLLPLAPLIAIATIGVGVMFYPLVAFPLVWYVIFTMPRELVDRHAARVVAAEAVRQVTAETSGGLGDYHIHRA